MDRYASGNRGNDKRYMEYDNDEREEFIEQIPKSSDWKTFCEAKHRKVISQPEKNQALQTHGSRTQIHWTQLHLLQRGDHIGWHRPYIIWHHAIVVDIDIRNKKLHVIHFTKDNGKAEIREERISVDAQLGDLFRFDYSRNITDINPPDLVLERARKARVLEKRRMKEMKGERNYKLLSKNCEHFATLCKTGREDSHQVHWARGKVKETVDTSSANALKEVAKQTCRKVIGKVAAAETFERMVKVIEKGAAEKMYRCMTERAGEFATVETFLRIDRDVAREVREIIADSARKEANLKRIGRASKWAGVVLVLGIETIHCAYDVYKIYQNKKAGKIEDQDFKATVTQRISEGVLGTGFAIGGGIFGEWVGGFAGGAIGSVFPVIGTTIGACAGSFIGVQLALLQAKHLVPYVVTGWEISGGIEIRDKRDGLSHVYTIKYKYYSI